MAVAMNPQSGPNDKSMTKTALIIWGLAIIVAGVFLLTRPVITAIIWVEILAFSWLIGGIFDVIGALVNRGLYWVWHLVAGVISVLAGLYVIGSPVLSTAFVLNIAFLFFAVSALADGIVNAFGAFKVTGGARWAGLVLAVLQIIIGGWLLLHPLVGMIALVPFFSLMLIIGGIITVVMAFRI